MIKGQSGTSVQLPRGRVFDNVPAQLPIIMHKKWVKTTSILPFFLLMQKTEKWISLWVHRVPDLVSSTMSKHGPGGHLRWSPKSPPIALHAKPNRLGFLPEICHGPSRICHGHYHHRFYQSWPSRTFDRHGFYQPCRANHSYEMVIGIQVDFHVNETHFHILTLKLTLRFFTRTSQLKQRR